MAPAERPDRIDSDSGIYIAPGAPMAGASHARWKRADTTSAVGAGVLGTGIGVFLERILLDAYVIPIVVLGLLMHSWGMYDKHRLESGATSGQLWWAEVLYWGCWIGLLGLGLYVALTVL